MNALMTTVLVAAEEGFDENSVTPTWVGFAVTFLLAAVTVLLILDMMRRVRRTRYRGEVREQLEAERLEADWVESDSEGNPADVASPEAPDDLVAPESPEEPLGR